MPPLPERGVTPRVGRAGLFLATVAADQITKAWVAAVLPAPGGPIEVGMLVNLVHVRNYGIGFGLLGGGGATQQWILATFAVAVAAGLLVMQARIAERVYAWGLVLIAAGAVGNAICRLARGSVVDFIDVHAGGYHWPAFNVADAAITVGVLCVMAHALPLPRVVARLRAPRRER